MIKLRVVGFSDDLKNLILSSRPQGRRGSHVTPIDDRLFDVLEDVWRRRREAERDERKAVRAAQVPVESKLAPREVQRLLRAGHSPADVAERAGVNVGWVERFYGPIVQEKSDVIASVQNLWLEKPKAGTSGAPLGEAVTQNLRSRHVRLTEDQLAEAWDATRQDGQPWIVSLEFSFRGRRQRAVWRYEPHGRSVAAGNRLAGDLGWVKNGKKAAARRAEAASPRKSARAKAARAKRAAKARKAPARRPAKRAAKRPVKRASRRPAKRPVKRSVARRPARKAPARRPARRIAAKRPRKAAVRARSTSRRPAARPRRSAAVRRRPARRPARRR